MNLLRGTVMVAGGTLLGLTVFIKYADWSVGRTLKRRRG